MQPTVLKYMEDSYLLSDTGVVLAINKDDQGRTVVILDQTIMYPQGGGQPWDTGTLSTSDTTFRVEEVRFIDGVVHHIGSFESGAFSQGGQIEIQVDDERRDLHRRLHSAGHLIDAAVTNLGISGIQPTKAFHYPEGASVEYSGTIEPEKREEIKQNIEAELNRMIKEGYETQHKLVTKAELAEMTDFPTLKFIPEDKPTRVVDVWGGQWIPCGGTHVKNISEIGMVTITKLKCKSGNTKISYTIS